jgi:[acyl-carrier-protein] S-malonyltransferase
LAALLGATLEQAEAACAAAPGACWLANDNAPGQIVIAGTPDGVDAGTAAAKRAGVRRAAVLNVGGAFHTPLMHDAAVALATELDGVAVSDTAVPVVSNADARPHADGTGWRSRLAAHVESPVRWREAQLTLAGLGATHLVEVGHGSMLAALAKRTVPEVSVHTIATPEDVETVVASLREMRST